MMNLFRVDVNGNYYWVLAGSKAMMLEKLEAHCRETDELMEAEAFEPTDIIQCQPGDKVEVRIDVDFVSPESKNSITHTAEEWCAIYTRPDCDVLILCCSEW